MGFGLKNDFFDSLHFMDLNDILSPPKAVKVKKTNMGLGEGGPVEFDGSLHFQFYP